VSTISALKMNKEEIAMGAVSKYDKILTTDVSK
jgi:hypothetical protein